MLFQWIGEHRDRPAVTQRIEQVWQQTGLKYADLVSPGSIHPDYLIAVTERRLFIFDGTGRYVINEYLHDDVSIDVVRHDQETQTVVITGSGGAVPLTTRRRSVELSRHFMSTLMHVKPH